MKVLLKNGNIVTDKVKKGDILIENGLIAKISESGSLKADKEIDCAGKYIIPGMIDMHAHLREPGLEYKEDLRSGAEAAVHGGFTTVCCMANTSPVVDNSNLVSWIIRLSEQIGLADIIPYGAVTKGMEGEELTEMGDILSAGACGFSDDGKAIMNAEVMRRALEYSRHFGAFISAHEDDLNLLNGGVVNEGHMSAVYGYKGIPAESESVMVGRDIQLARLTGGRVHICHVSSRHSVNLIRMAKQEGLNVTAEVTHNHLHFNEDACSTYDTNTKIAPPFRAEEDRVALLAAVKDGTIDCVVTDHAPHHIDDKFKEYDYASFGVIGLQTVVPVLVGLINSGKMSWEEIAKATSYNPAGILKLTKKGLLKEGYVADIAVIDPNIEYIFDETVNRSKSNNTPFWKKKLKGKVVNLIKSGKVIF